MLDFEISRQVNKYNTTMWMLLGNYIKEHIKMFAKMGEVPQKRWYFQVTESGGRGCHVPYLSTDCKISVLEKM